MKDVPELYKSKRKKIWPYFNHETNFYFFFVANFAEQKKVPPRHPLQRLNRLNEFAEEWLSDNLREKQAGRWRPKFQRLSEKF